MKRLAHLDQAVEFCIMMEVSATHLGAASSNISLLVILASHGILLIRTDHSLERDAALLTKSCWLFMVAFGIPNIHLRGYRCDFHRLKTHSLLPWREAQSCGKLGSGSKSPTLRSSPQTSDM
jgi:hypothetical protein